MNITTLYRALYGRMVSSLVSRIGLRHVSMAESVVDRTFIDAGELWNASLPGDPEDWLFNRCTNNLIRRDEDGIDVSSEALLRCAPHEIFGETESKESQLRLLFICCDPRLSEKSRLVLVLRDLCGFRIDELAVALDVSVDVIDDTLLQGKSVVVENEMLFLAPDLLFVQHIDSVHSTIYRMFNDGCIAGAGEEIRREFCIEAMRLTRSMVEVASVRNHDTFALFALMCLHASRFDSRIGTSGDLLELELQDRSRWDRELIQVGVEYLKHAHASNTVTRYILEGAIASVHGVAERYEETNWAVISGLYARLSDICATPMNDLNRCVALLHTAGGLKALEFIQSSAHLEWLNNCYLYYVIVGKIYLNLGRTQQAVTAYEKALSLARLRAEQDFLHRKILTIQTHLN